MKINGFLIAAAVLVSPSWAAGNTTASEEVQKYAIHQSSPCIGQPRTLQELTEAFNGGRFPSTSDMTGTWAEIGFFEAGGADRNCSGLMRDKKLEAVMIANGYSLELHIIGTHVQKPSATPDDKGSLAFPVDFEGDALPTYRCRIIGPDTLACLVSVYEQGAEFKKKAVSQDEIYSPPSAAYR